MGGGAVLHGRPVRAWPLARERLRGTGEAGIRARRTSPPA